MDSDDPFNISNFDFMALQKLKFDFYIGVSFMVAILSQKGVVQKSQISIFYSLYHCNPLMFQTISYVGTNSERLKYQKFTPSGSNEIEIRKKDLCSLYNSFVTCGDWSDPIIRLMSSLTFSEHTPTSGCISLPLRTHTQSSQVTFWTGIDPNKSNPVF